MLLAHGATIRLGAQFDGLAERGGGAWEGLSREEIDARYPGDVAAGRWPDGFEPDSDVFDRAGCAIADIVKRYRGARAVVVSHGGVMGTLERHVLGNAAEPERRFDHLEGLWLRADGPRLTAGGGRIRLVAPSDRTDGAPDRGDRDL